MKKIYFFPLLFAGNISLAQNAPLATPDFLTVNAGTTVPLIKPLLNDSGDNLVLDTFFFDASKISVNRISLINTNQSYHFLKLQADSFFYGLDTIKYVACNSYGCDTGLIFVVVNFKFYNSFELLDINNISARFNSGGSNFWDMIGAAGFEVPKGSGVHSIFSQSIWIGGKDNSNSLHIAAQKLGLDGGDFYPGPLTDMAAFPPGSYGYYYEIQKWNRLWKINKSEIDYHISHWNQSGYTIPQIFFDWPAHGNTNYGQAANLAPFFDNDNNGIYSPANGDYPLIKGDQAIYFILNDNKTHVESSGAPLTVEIHGMAYAFNCAVRIPHYSILFF